jgi:hypothetical protein
VAAFYGHHEHHSPSLEVFLRFGKKDACCAAHTLAEIYATLTGRTGKDRVSGDQAMLLLSDMRERLTVVTLNQEEYFRAIQASCSLGSPVAVSTTRSSLTARSRQVLKAFILGT